MQADESKGKDKKSELRVARDLFEREGVVGFYKGLWPLLVALASSNFIYFYCYNALKTAVVLRSRDGKISTGKNLAVASIAGAINVLVTCPLWVASTRLKLQANPNAAHGAPTATATAPPPTTKKPYTSLVDAVARIAKEEGVAALWNGTGASLVLVSNPTIQVRRRSASRGPVTWRGAARVRSLRPTSRASRSCTRCAATRR